MTHDMPQDVVRVSLMQLKALAKLAGRTPSDQTHRAGVTINATASITTLQLEVSGILAYAKDVRGRLLLPDVVTGPGNVCRARNRYFFVFPWAVVSRLVKLVDLSRRPYAELYMTAPHRGSVLVNHKWTDFDTTMVTDPPWTAPAFDAMNHSMPQRVVLPPGVYARLELCGKWLRDVGGAQDIIPRITTRGPGLPALVHWQGVHHMQAAVRLLADTSLPQARFSGP